MQKRLTLVEMVIIMVVLGLLVGLIIPALNAKREKARRISCASNLKSIGLALKQYAMDFNDIFPDGKGDVGLEQLRSNDYLTDNKIYACPSTRDTGNVGSSVVSSYVYLAGMSEADSADSSIILDKSGNHRKFGNALFLDGHVTGYAGPNWAAPENVGVDIHKINR